jgi:fructose-1,6-bisphosphatase
MYVETSIFNHVLEGDIDDAKRKLQDFYGSELDDLAETADTLVTLVYAERRRRDSSRDG